MTRNADVGASVQLILDQVDLIASGSGPGVFASGLAREWCDKQITHSSGSVRLASVFFVAYSVIDRQWNTRRVPTGIRGAHGDKLLAEQLTRRHVTLHKCITAFGENLGWKGNVTNVDLTRDPRFAEFLAFLRGQAMETRRLMLSYIASRIVASIHSPTALPPVGPNVLTYAEAKKLFLGLIDTPSEGHIPQFLICALLFIHRSRFGTGIETHHPHASDKFDETAGDIDEYLDDRLIAAYEVTARPDWKNRLSDFRAKMDRHGLSKYVIIATHVNQDTELSSPDSLIDFLQPVGRDIAVVDIADVICVSAAELRADELRAAVNKAYEYLSSDKLCGRPDIQAAYNARVQEWLDDAMVRQAGT